MGAAKKLEELPAEERRRFDFSKPVLMRWWKLPSGTYIGTGQHDMVAVLPLPSLVKDGIEIDGVVEAIEHYPAGQVVVHVRCGVTHQSPGVLRQLILTGGHGEPQ